MKIIVSYIPGEVQTGGRSPNKVQKRKKATEAKRRKVEGGGGTKEQNPEGGASDPRCGRVKPPPPASPITGSASRKPHDVTQTLVGTPCWYIGLLLGPC